MSRAKRMLEKQKKGPKKDKYAQLRHRGEYKPKDVIPDLPREEIQDNDRKIDSFYRFTKFGRINNKLKPYNTKKKLYLFQIIKKNLFCPCAA